MCFYSCSWSWKFKLQCAKWCMCKKRQSGPKGRHSKAEWFCVDISARHRATGKLKGPASTETRTGKRHKWTRAILGQNNNWNGESKHWEFITWSNNEVKQKTRVKKTKCEKRPSILNRNNKSDGVFLFLVCIFYVLCLFCCYVALFPGCLGVYGLDFV